jgi:hypothetical protein
MDPDTLSTRMAAASRSYMRPFSGGRLHAGSIDVDMTARIVAMRSRIRQEEGGGGMCHLVTDWLHSEYGCGRMGVSYLSPEGEVICADHYVAVLSDGSILDPTSDQMGEGHDMRLLRTDDPEYGRYRPGFFEDFHPGHHDNAGADAWADLPHVVDDAAQQDLLGTERGCGWWLIDPTALRSYLEEQTTLVGTDDFYRSWLRHRIDDIDTRHPGACAPSPEY